MFKNENKNLFLKISIRKKKQHNSVVLLFCQGWWSSKIMSTAVWIYLIFCFVFNIRCFLSRFLSFLLLFLCLRLINSQKEGERERENTTRTLFSHTWRNEEIIKNSNKNKTKERAGLIEKLYWKRTLLSWNRTTKCLQHLFCCCCCS